MPGRLQNLNQHFVIDDSPSMREGYYGTKDQGRTKDVALVVESVVPDCLEDDKDGIDICFLNANHPATNMTVPSDVKDHINSVTTSGSTPIGKCLQTLVDTYWKDFKMGNTNPKNFIIITDGVPDDEGPVINAIVDCGIQALLQAKDPKKVTFFFLQVGNPTKLGDPTKFTDPEKRWLKSYQRAFKAAGKFLDKLDDGLRDPFLDELRKKAKEEPELEKYLAEIEDIDEEDGLGRFDIVDKQGLEENGSDLNSDGVRKAMYGARYKELDEQKEGMHGKKARP